MSAFESDVAEANRLYWETEDSVASIANRLDVSRRALYDAVRPIPAGFTCLSCGGEVAYENRLARRQGVAACAECGASRSIDGEAAAARSSAVVVGVVRGDAPASPGIDLRDPDLRHRAVMLGGVAIAGVAVGTMAALLATRKDT